MKRRTLLVGGVLGGAGLVAPGMACALPTVPLVFHHLHTGERLEIVHRRAGEYVPAALNRVDRLLRDFRTGEVHRIDPELLDLLQAVRLRLGSRGAFQIISGFRSPRTNQMLRRKSAGVAKRSLHTVGRAIDVRLVGAPTKSLRDAAIALAAGGVGYYGRSDFVHLDTGRVRRW
jgi:uncharacterized protein YcbK (DUF882 family)